MFSIFHRAHRGSPTDRWLNWVLTLLPLVGVGLVLALIGWPQTDETTEILLIAARVFAGCYGFLVWVRWLGVEAPHWETWRGYLFGPGLALIILASAAFEDWIGQYLIGHIHGHPIHAWLIGLAAIQQILALMSRFGDWMPAIERSFLSRASPGLILVSTFTLLVLAGAGLLKMPNATTMGISWIDAIFTSTSAVCVTGLIVVDTATAFTPLGQAIILILIQLGAFGIVTLTFFLAVLSGQGFSVSSRVFLGDLLSVDNMRSLTVTLTSIVVLTFSIEIVGAICLHAAWSGEMGPDLSLWWVSLFHSVSAFCNAGFSLFTDGLADPRAVNELDVQATLMVLIILGGIGFPVILEFLRMCRWIFHPSERPRHHGHFITLHTRLVIMLTLLLLGGGALLLWIGGGGNPSSEPTSGAWEALFNAVTARTAGFNISNMGSLPAASTAVMILLMFIGGSPGGIAGGIKTTTFAMAILNLHRILLSRRDVQMFERRIEDVVTNRAFAVVLISILWVFCATTVMLYLQPEFTLIDTLFECVSALATVGLTRGITSELTEGSKIVLILTMFVGRIGVLNFFFSLLPAKPKKVRLRYPRERIIIE